MQNRLHAWNTHSYDKNSKKAGDGNWRQLAGVNSVPTYLAPDEHDSLQRDVTDVDVTAISVDIHTEVSTVDGLSC